MSLTGGKIVFKAPILDLSKIDVSKMDRKRSDFKNFPFSNGKSFFYSKGKEYLMTYIGPLNKATFNGHGTLRFYNKHNKYLGSYKGIWKNSVPQGEGIFMNTKNEIQMEGLFTNNEIMSGYGIQYKYVGGMVNGKKEGYGILIQVPRKNVVYDGEWKNGLYHGHGILYKGIFKKYEGGFTKGNYDGEGTSYYKYSEIVYKKGCWKNGDFHGIGKVFFKNGVVQYDGWWKKNKRDNFGKSYNENGILLYQGQWKDNEKNGYGTLYTPKIWRYKSKSYISPTPIYYGNFKDDKKHGFGTRFYQNGNILFEGKYENNKRHGKGNIFSISGERTKVIYSKGVLHGAAIIYEDDGKTIKIKGKYIKNVFIDEAFFSIQKFLETNDTKYLNSVVKKDIARYAEKHFQNTMSLGQTKDEMTQLLRLLYSEGKKESTELDQKEDLFGNIIENPCRGSDGEIYDLRSMVYLFEKDDNESYRNIRYTYKDGQCVPNFPIMANGIRLSSYTLIEKEN